MAIHPRGKVCVLSYLEVEQLQQNVQPNCLDHSHISLSKAHEMCRSGCSQYVRPVAVWVGPRHVQMVDTGHLAVVHESPLCDDAGEKIGMLRISTLQVVYG